MRLDPDEEGALQIRLSVQRFMCNWLWPGMFIGTLAVDIWSFYNDGFDDVFRWLWAAFWLWLGVRWWRKDVRLLQETREKLKEAHL